MLNSHVTELRDHEARPGISDGTGIGGRDLVKAYLFDEEHGEEVDGWEDALRTLGDGDVLWIDLDSPSDELATTVCEALGTGELDLNGPRGRDRASFSQNDGYLHVTSIAVSEKESDPDRETVAIDCFVGANWIVTVHGAEIAALDDFRRIAEGEGAVGRLDAPSFLAALLEWVIASYLRAFDEIEAQLEDFDVDALKRPTTNPEQQISTLVAARRRVGHLRRALAPHREIFAALSHSEFDPISTEGSSARFTQVAGRVDAALASARDAKDGIASSFDVLIVRTEHRTNEIIKILTIASILLLPGALLAGIAGMNVNFKLGVFFSSTLFWAVLATIVGIAGVTLGLARYRRWI